MVFVADLENLQLDADDRAHLGRSLRVRDGEPITAADGDGRWRSARFGEEIQPDGPVIEAARPTPPLTVAFAPVKGDRSELVVQKLTELGIDTIVPVLTERTVVRWDEARAVKNHQKHQRIAREAAMQSRNLWLPTVEPLTTLDRFLAGRPQAVLCDPAGTTSLGGDDAVVVIGPEGGLSPAELASGRTRTLAGNILRTETAAISAGVVLVANRAER